MCALIQNKNHVLLGEDTGDSRVITLDELSAALRTMGYLTQDEEVAGLCLYDESLDLVVEIGKRDRPVKVGDRVRCTTQVHNKLVIGSEYTIVAIDRTARSPYFTVRDTDGVEVVAIFAGFTPIARP